MNKSFIDKRTTVANCHNAKGVVVVIDVLRAFTTAAYAFDRGAEEILLVSTVKEAFSLRNRNSAYLLIGEVNGLMIEGFDLPNSPSAIESLDLTGRRLVMRSTAGTQGVVSASKAENLLVASLSVARATSDYIRALNPEIVTFVETGVRQKGGGEEDIACADLIASLLVNELANKEVICTRVMESRAAKKFINNRNPDFPRADLERATKVDQFSFCMKVERIGDLLVLRPDQPPTQIQVLTNYPS